MSIKLYGKPSTASFAPHVLLREIGAPFEFVRVDFETGAQRDPEFLKLNPNARVPVLVDGDHALFEAAAICLHLADAHPQAGLAPALGSAARAQFYKWLIWLTNTLQPDLMIYFYAERYGATTDAEKAALRAVAEARVAKHFDLLDSELAKGDGPYLLGETYSAADAYALMLARWTRGMARPGWNLPHVGRLCRETLKRPAVRATFEAEGLELPVLEPTPV